MTTLDTEMIADLPEPVRRSLRRSGAVGREIPQAVTVRQQGRIRPNPASRWLPFSAIEDYTLAEPGFVWKAKLRVAGVPVGRATDSLDHGTGRMQVKLLGVVTVVDASGPEMDQGSVLRWLNETMWFPAVWATEVFSWEPVDENSARASITVGGQTHQAEFRFDEDGRLVNFLADRYRDTGDGFEMIPWSTPLSEHARFNGIEVPSFGSAVWHRPDGDIEYIQIRATDVSHQ